MRQTRFTLTFFVLNSSPFAAIVKQKQESLKISISDVYLQNVHCTVLCVYVFFTQAVHIYSMFIFIKYSVCLLIY
jgi:hypothetical protein